MNDMNENITFDEDAEEALEEETNPSMLVKVLSIIGFIATVLLILWLLVLGVRRAPDLFSSLATTAGSLQNAAQVTEINLSTQKKVLNSGEPFTVTWNEVKERGEFRFGYQCIDGVALQAKDSTGDMISIECNRALPLPSSINELVVSIESKNDRFVDVTLMLTFINETRQVKGETTVTIVNASIQPESLAVATSTEENMPAEDEPTATTTVTNTPAPAPVPVPVYVIPQSNPLGYVDLSVTMLGHGVIRNGVFSVTPTYTFDRQNALKFDIKNIGTKTSGPWSFETILPSGERFKSPTQIGLRPQEHVEFTLGFGLEDTRDDLVELRTTVRSDDNTKRSNDTAVWYVVVSR